MLQWQSIKLLIFIVVSQAIILVEVHQFLWLCITFLLQVLHQPHCLRIFEARKPVSSQAFVHYRLQIVWQVWFHLFNLVTSYPMFQVCNKAVDQVISIPLFQYHILVSILLFHSHKPHSILPVSISFSSLEFVCQPPSTHTSIGLSIHWETFKVIKFSFYYYSKYSSKSTA